MSDRQLFGMMRERARGLASKAADALAPCGSVDGEMAPHVARERILKLRSLARQINALCDWIEAQP